MLTKASITWKIALAFLLGAAVVFAADGGLLSGEQGLEIVGQVAQGMEAIEVIQNVKPDVVLLDASLPEIEYTEVVRLIKQHSPESRILLLTAARNDAEIGRGLKAGANEAVIPKAGRLVMFPSWLLHQVKPYRGNAERISIAFNLTV